MAQFEAVPCAGPSLAECGVRNVGFEQVSGLRLWSAHRSSAAVLKRAECFAHTDSSTGKSGDASWSGTCWGYEIVGIPSFGSGGHSNLKVARASDFFLEGAAGWLPELSKRDLFFPDNLAQLSGCADVAALTQRTAVQYEAGVIMLLKVAPTGVALLGRWNSNFLHHCVQGYHLPQSFWTIALPKHEMFVSCHWERVAARSMEAPALRVKCIRVCRPKNDTLYRFLATKSVDI